MIDENAWKSVPKMDQLHTHQAIVKYNSPGKKKIIDLANLSSDRPKGNYSIPFDPDGNLLRTPIPKYRFDGNGRMSVDSNSIIWRPNYKIDAELQVQEYIKVNDGIVIKVLDLECKVCYNIFLKDFFEIVSGASIVNGVIQRNTFEFVKRGQKYGIKLSGRQASKAAEEISG